MHLLTVCMLSNFPPPSAPPVFFYNNNDSYSFLFWFLVAIGFIWGFILIAVPLYVLCKNNNNTRVQIQRRPLHPTSNVFVNTVTV